MKKKRINITLSPEEYDILWTKVVKSKTVRIQNGQLVPCMVRYIKEKIGIKYN